jgi:sugar fermentation stimulation protein A
MRYPNPILEGHLIRRYKRFLTDVEIDGKKLTVHCPNSGSMAGLTDYGNPVRISGPHNGKRKHAYTLEQIRITRPDRRKIWVGVNTMIPNIIAYEAAQSRKLPGLENYTTVRREVKLGSHSRIDLKLDGNDLPPCWIEVKNVTLVLSDPADKLTVNHGNIAAFPDAVTTRGAKHLRELIKRVKLGERAVMLYIIQRSDGDTFAPAVGFDPDYTNELKKAISAGVDILPLRVRVTKSGIWLGEILPANI